MKRQEMARMGQETVALCHSGWYANRAGRRVDIAADVQDSAANTRLIGPGDWRSILRQGRSAATGALARIEVTPETTLAALQRLIVDERIEDPAALNFASAKNPGGGFLSGSRAQEESLARSSGLYLTLLTQQAYYDANRHARSSLYTDHAIYSPRVPVFRDSEGEVLDQHYLASFITMPAVNAGAIPPDSSDVDHVDEVMEHRMNCVLGLAAAMGHQALVLGAWGCGVFRNSPETIAGLWTKCLSGEDSWRTCFERIVFAVFDPGGSSTNRLPFERSLGSLDE